MKKLRVAVIGASGYSGGELLRLLFRHDACEITVITSRKYEGKPLGEVFPRFADEKITFSAPDTALISDSADVVFLALPHGLASEYAIPLLESSLTVIDISADFRLKSETAYKEYYGVEHPAPALLRDAVYGLPERYREKIKKADLIACPGCYPTSVILPCAPLLESGAVSPQGIAVASLSGVTGAGRKVDLPYIFPECNESIRAYKATGHRHLPEIEQELGAAAGAEEMTINFVPHLIPVNRGINSTIFLNANNTEAEKIHEIYRKAYDKEAFVRVLAPGKLPDTKNVTMGNCCEIGFEIDSRNSKIIAVSAIDNLTKGASGQAIQCMNIRFGFDEKLGLT